MIKHFCDVCGEEIANEKERVVLEVRIQRGLPRITRTVEYHTGCVDKAFGKGFSESVIAEDAEAKKRIAERRAAREAKNNDKTET